MRCEGWIRRTGGVFTFGEPTWTQCESNAIAILTVEQATIAETPVCRKCWDGTKERKFNIVKEVLLTEAEKA